MQAPVKFRYNAAITVAAVVAVIGGLPLATSAWFVAPILLVPLAIAVWGWRAGTDATVNGVRVRALFGSRFVPWPKIESLVVGERNRVFAHTAAGSEIRLTAVTPADLPKLVAASGEQLSTPPSPR
ncbi:hypothetical protein GCM10009557_53150 [Virgisporangium ochraceum]|uniref:Low molecular weight protein antigen 6 PH domain-containing protein n=1 Tax=Virgisporangium ochraceum TaxID=65505 RepID=A0A8J4EC44_9ACTN|nr:PH domain-containing protein [Virgisporangium ochraceum]GIJ69264.1 hypothetical protein Voc01_041810 [Virgisporangium ochraceum]